MQALPVTAVVRVLREVLESSDLFSDLWVQGEIAGLTRSQAGHRYFSLKDAGATLRSVLFARTQPGMALANGDGVLAHGRISIYEPRGELQFIVDFVRPEGVGIMQARFDELQERLAAEGLFAPERKRPLPDFPRRIGLVTSPSGAAMHDVLTVVERRWPLATVVLSPTLVQGEQAPLGIVGALRRLWARGEVDTVILARGGGSAEDLWAFNDERVARAIFAAPVPVVCGVGHENDVTISDLVADVRAPTPTGAAELATPNIADLLFTLGRQSVALERTMRTQLAHGGEALERAIQRTRRAAPATAALRERVSTALRTMQAHSEHGLTHRKHAVEAYAGRLTALSPRATLERGYAIVQREQGDAIVTGPEGLAAGEPLIIAAAGGNVAVTVRGQ